MKRIIRIPRLIISCICVALVIVLIIIAAVRVANRASGKAVRECELFFLNSSRTELECEVRRIRYKDKAELCVNTINALIKGPEKNSLKPILSGKTKFLQIDMADDENIITNFSAEFLTGDSKRDVLSVYAVVKTLCSIGGINSVKILVEGNDIYTEQGDIIGYLTSEDINLASDVNRAELHEVTLYFTKKDTNVLYPEKREVKITDQLPLAQHVVGELINGPNDESLMPCLAKDSNMIGVSISGDKCYVDFTENFVGKNNGSPDHNRLVIYSIVNSLCELDTIAEVQLLFEGKKIEAFGDIPLGSLIEADFSLTDNQAQ